MEWYYSDGKTQSGPVDDGEFERLQRVGTISAQTLVWNQTMANWLPWSQVQPVPAPSAPPSGGFGGNEFGGGAGGFGGGGFGSASSVPTWGAPMGQQACTVCGRYFPEGDLLNYESARICAECKPTYFQRLREGASVVGEMVYAGFWVRFGAKFIDGILLNIVTQILSGIMTVILGDVETANPNDIGALLGLGAAYFFVPVAVAFIYSVYFTGKYGATPGKMAMKIKVVMADGSPITFGVAAGRWFAAALSYITLYIGFIMAAFDEEKRTLHDRIVGTRVIRNR